MIQVYLDSKDLSRWLNASLRLQNEAKRLEDDLPRLQAIDMSQLLVRNIMTQKGMGGYPAYNPRYRAWKQAYGRAHGFWMVFGDLLKNVTHFRVLTGRTGQRAWKAGIPEGVVDQGGKSWFGRGDYGKRKPIAMYGRVMEEGGFIRKSGYHPPRPLFEPTTNEYESTGFVQRANEALNKLGNCWR